jgi:hypothetical protein
VDFLDAAGGWVGTGAGPPPETTFIRRWSIARVAGRDDLIVLQVRVTTLRGESVRSAGTTGVSPGDGWMVTMKARRAP